MRIREIPRAEAEAAFTLRRPLATRWCRRGPGHAASSTHMQQHAQATTSRLWRPPVSSWSSRPASTRRKAAAPWRTAPCRSAPAGQTGKRTHHVSHSGSRCDGCQRAKWLSKVKLDGTSWGNVCFTLCWVTQASARSPYTFFIQQLCYKSEIPTCPHFTRQSCN